MFPPQPQNTNPDTKLDPFAQSKEEAGRAAAQYVKDNMKVGLGTGSTVYWTILAIAERIQDGLQVSCTATSLQTEVLAAKLGIPLYPLDTLGMLDIAIDGADEIDLNFHCTKGGGGAHTREKIVAAQAEQFIIVVDESKLVSHLGPFGTPIEILDFAPQCVLAQCTQLGAESFKIRSQKSDNGNLLADVFFPKILDPNLLAAQLSNISGIVEHGIFPAAMVSKRIVAGSAGIDEKDNPIHRFNTRE